MCAYVFVYACIPDFFMDAVNSVLRRTLSAAAVRSLGFLAFPSIYLNSLSFSQSDDIAFPFGILTACDTRCHRYSPLYMFSGGSVTRL